MKVLHIVGGDLNRGAARGAYWLHLGLKEMGVASTIFTNSKTGVEDPDVIYTVHNNLSKAVNSLRKQIDRLPILFYRKRLNDVLSTGISGYNFTKTKAYREADIIHLHWIGAAFVNIKHLRKIKKPIIWTLRDMWPFTGGCHYAMECRNYESGCGYCKQLNSSRKYDLSRFVLYRKKKHIPPHCKIIGISSWLSEIAKTSELLKNFDIRTISNNVNTNEFFPIPKVEARKVLGINTKKKIILTGSFNLKSRYKGFQDFLKALKHLDQSEYYLCLFGKLDNTILQDIPFEYKNFGFLNDQISLRLLYSCADVFAAPSKREAFGKTIAEAMACGTPTVCFDATGPRDIVTHKIDGYKAEPFNSLDLARGMEWVARQTNYQKLCEKARDKVINNFDARIIARQYLNLYHEISNYNQENRQNLFLT